MDGCGGEEESGYLMDGRQSEPPITEANVPEAPADCSGLYAEFHFEVRCGGLTEDWFTRTPVLGYLGNEDDLFRSLRRSFGKKYELRDESGDAVVDYVLVPVEAVASRGVTASELAGWINGLGLSKKAFLLTGGGSVQAGVTAGSSSSTSNRAFMGPA